jgi:hypothetical protein
MQGVGEREMKEITNDQVCDRADDLLGFLYGELTDWETRKFEQHLRDCAPCKTEYAAFGELRESVLAWRNEALGVSAVTPVVIPLQDRRPSAIAAIREFFNLSPLWMKGAAAFATVLFCAFATLAIAHLIEKNNLTTRADGNKIYTQQELDEQVAKAMKEKTVPVEIMKDQDQKTAANSPPPSKGPEKRRVTGANNEVAGYSQKLRRPLSRRERQELAADLRLLSSYDDGLDLVGDSNNQPPK